MANRPQCPGGRDRCAIGQRAVRLGVIVLAFAGRCTNATLVAATSSSTSENPGFFDPDGYYFPSGDVVVAGHKIDWIGLRTLEYYYGGALHYEKPRFVQPTARLVLTRLADRKRSTHECPQPVITRDELGVLCRSTPIGVVSIRGTFVDKRGQFWNRSDVAPQKTVVAVATVTFTESSKGQVSRRVSFTYWERD